MSWVVIRSMVIVLVAMKFVRMAFAWLLFWASPRTASIVIARITIATWFVSSE